MNQIFRVFAGVAALLVLLFLGGFWLLFFSERPPLEIDPETLAGDGSTLNYCELPVLDGRGKRALEIPKGNTPGCGYDHFPLPISGAVYRAVAGCCRRSSGPLDGR